MHTRRSASQEADAAREAMRSLAHATRKIEEPSEVYEVIGSLTGVLVATEQVLHQLGRFHDDLVPRL